VIEKIKYLFYLYYLFYVFYFGGLRGEDLAEKINMYLFYLLNFEASEEMHKINENKIFIIFI